MWEMVSDIFTSGDITVIVAVGLLAVLLVKSGTIKLKTRHFQMGYDPREKERDVLRAQIEYLSDFLKSKEDDVNEWFLKNIGDNPNEYLTQLVLEHLIDEVTSWCLFNHLSLDEKYLDVKRSKVRAVVEQDLIMPVAMHDRFYEAYSPWVEECLRYLITIRELKNGKSIY